MSTEPENLGRKAKYIYFRIGFASLFVKCLPCNYSTLWMWSWLVGWGIYRLFRSPVSNYFHSF